MPLLHDVAHLGHAELLTPEPDKSLWFFTQVLGLTENGTSGDSVYLRTWDDYEHHSLKLTASHTSGLRRTGLRASSEEALKILERDPVSALVTDLHLPRMGGLELIAHARALPRASRLPIVVLSGDSDPRTPERVLGAGADAFFAKPYSPAAVRQKLEHLMNAV